MIESENAEIPEETNRKRLRIHHFICLGCFEKRISRMDTMDLPGGVRLFCGNCEKHRILVAKPLHPDEPRMLVCSNEDCSNGWSGNITCSECKETTAELDPLQ